MEQVKRVLPMINFHFFWGKTLYHKDDIPFKISKVPLTSKTYRIPTAAQAEPRKIFDYPSKLKVFKKVKNSLFPSRSTYGFDENENNLAKSFVEDGETAALERLQ
jgi:deoxyribodipyrimidine photo-lyase